LSQLRVECVKLGSKGNLEMSVSASARTEGSQEENKRGFYNQLHRECSKIPKYDMLLILMLKLGQKAFFNKI
jgi:hypothetical protein